ncbi:hypothetical protein ACFXKG_28910 [Streptomyces sp. NPDC059255]|uniref:glutamine amidotransferase-related protein n=1 Tax=Streptomyces sp. NPDC059255 TaxID=3346793 RepID=UPI0036976CFC
MVILHDDPADVIPDPAEFDDVVLPSGSGHPREARDFGISARLIAEVTITVLGVCLGRQGIELGAGGRVAPAPQPRHGHRPRVRHDGRDLLVGAGAAFHRGPLPLAGRTRAAARDPGSHLPGRGRGPDGSLAPQPTPVRGQFHPDTVLLFALSERLLVPVLRCVRARGRPTRATSVCGFDREIRNLIGKR